jgi:S1-C subfamily serine protease
MNKLYGLLALGAVALGLIAMAPAPDSLLDRTNGWALIMDEKCSAEVVDAERNLIATAAHCTTLDEIKNPVPVVFWKPYFDANGVEDLSKRQRLEAKIVARDDKHDVAIYQLIYGDVTEEVTIAEEPPKYGDAVATVGNPLMMPRVIAFGTVIKPVTIIKNSLWDAEVILFDAFMDSGSSGGALLNANGELIGLTNWTRRSPDGNNSFHAATSVKYVKALLETVK